MHREDSLRRPFLSSSEHDDSAVEGHEESPVGEDHDVREGSPLQVEGEGVFLATSGSHLSESSEFSSFRSLCSSVISFFFFAFLHHLPGRGGD